MNGPASIDADTEVGWRRLSRTTVVAGRLGRGLPAPLTPAKENV